MEAAVEADHVEPGAQQVIAEAHADVAVRPGQEHSRHRRTASHALVTTTWSLPLRGRYHLLTLANSRRATHVEGR